MLSSGVVCVRKGCFDLSLRFDHVDTLSGMLIMHTVW